MCFITGGLFSFIYASVYSNDIKLVSILNIRIKTFDTFNAFSFTNGSKARLRVISKALN